MKTLPPSPLQKLLPLLSISPTAHPFISGDTTAFPLLMQTLPPSPPQIWMGQRKELSKGTHFSPLTTKTHSEFKGAGTTLKKLMLEAWVFFATKEASLAPNHHLSN
jgi:hypothetical protein